MNKTYPLVFCRGIARFDILRDRFCSWFGLSDPEFTDELHYFKGIKTFLESRGFTVYHTTVGFSDGVDERARQLAEQVRAIVDRENADKVHLVGHSMGGLDARHMLVDIPEISAQVASVTTIGTPHLGTSLADMALQRGGERLIESLEAFIHLDGFRDLTLDALAEFNARARDSEAENRVLYRTYASAQRRQDTFLPLQLGSSLLYRAEGQNDGLVSLRSQRWSSSIVSSRGIAKRIIQRRFPFPADHLNECGWWEPGELELAAGPIGQQIRDFEKRIRLVYLEIAESLAMGEGSRLEPRAAKTRA